MKATSLVRLGAKHLRGHFAEALFARTGLDLTRPLVFNANIEAHCNIRCRYCACWRQEEYPSEITIEQWKQVLLNIKQFTGSFSISFTGGEPFLKPGLLDLLCWCYQNTIYAGITTNGTLFSDENITKLVGSHPWNVNVSVDAADADVNDYLRGKEGSFAEVSSGVRRLVVERRRAGATFPIIIKPTVTAKNFRELHKLVRWAEEVGATSVNFQPVDRWTPETYDELWIAEAQIPALQAVCEELVRMKLQGASILNPASTIRKMVEHFRDDPRQGRSRFCAMHSFSIEANADVQACPCSPVIGNLLKQSARDIWYGPRATEFRRQSLNSECLNLNTSATPKSLFDKVKMGCRLLFG